jgi:hypothetical protein
MPSERGRYSAGEIELEAAKSKPELRMKRRSMGSCYVYVLVDVKWLARGPLSVGHLKRSPIDSVVKPFGI